MKNILIFNGNPNSKNASFDNYLNDLSVSLKKKEHKIDLIKLRDKKINFCIGCYSCWLKTPGICIYKDDGVDFLEKYINSDIIVFSSPVIMGFISSLLKSLLERSLPLLHPYVAIIDDRSQHFPRYDKYPATCLLIQKSDSFSESSKEIIDKVFRSSSIRKLVFSKMMEDNIEEVSNEINNI